MRNHTLCWCECMVYVLTIPQGELDEIRAAIIPFTTHVMMCEDECHDHHHNNSDIVS